MKKQFMTYSEVPGVHKRKKDRNYSMKEKGIMDRIERLEQGMLKEDVPQFNVGNTVRVHVKIKEGEKERIQIFEGVVIRRKGARNRETFTVRKVAFNVGVERIFPVHSPWIAKVEVIRIGAVRRAKLYYLRERTGRAARLREKERVRPSKASG